MGGMKPIATDIYTFSNLIGGGYLYVDKTGILADLVSGRRGKQFFFSRPRRFGKSLTVTTLQAVFEGRRDLFRGLAIDRSDYGWKAYPVIRMNRDRLGSRSTLTHRRTSASPASSRRRISTDG